MKIRRIVVGVEAGRRGRSTLEAAATLAARMHAELLGMFVEDVNLLHLAGLPFALEVGAASATRRALDVAGMERSLRALASEARSTLQALAARGPVPWSFRVARGSLMAELLAAAGEGDLLVGAAAAWEPGFAATAEPLALRLAASAHAAVLLLQRDLPPYGPVTAVCAASAEPARVVAAALGLVHSVGDGLRIVLIGGDRAAADAWERDARRLLDAQGEKAQFRRVPAGDVQALHDALAVKPPGVLMLAGTYGAPERAALGALLGLLGCPVLVLPEPAPSPGSGSTSRGKR